MMPETKLILASASPRRKELLAAAGYVFDVLPADEEEEAGLCSNCGPAEMVAELATAKAADVVRQLVKKGEWEKKSSENTKPICVVLAADTVAECQGHILGKPNNEEHAGAMLTMMSGQQHRVYTGVCVWKSGQKGPVTQVDVTMLRMDTLSEEQLDAYLETGQWQGKAGAFGFQDGLDWVHIEQGSESNVVGLPMDLVETMLRAFD